MIHPARTLGAAIGFTVAFGLLTACEGGRTDPGPVTGPVIGPEMVVHPNHLIMGVGETQILSATVREDPAWDWGGQITWTSSNPEVVRVTDSGEVTAINPGDAFVVAETGEGLSSEALIVVLGDTENLSPQLRDLIR